MHRFGPCDVTNYQRVRYPHNMLVQVQLQFIYTTKKIKQLNKHSTIKTCRPISADDITRPKSCAPAGKSKFRCRFQRFFETFFRRQIKTVEISIRRRYFDVEKALKNVRIFRRRNFDVDFKILIILYWFGGKMIKKNPRNSEAECKDLFIWTELPIAWLISDPIIFSTMSMEH